MTPSAQPRVLVRKYGGSSLATVARIREVAAALAARHAEGVGLVAVVSAMGRTTDELDYLARQASPRPARRELDMLLSVGERITMSLMCMALADLGVDAVSFTGSQCGIVTDGSHTDARILEVKADRVREALDAGRVVVVAGFQGVSRDREITTLGRGGSDTTAVALAAAVGATRCEILKDVDGVFSADPHLVASAERHDVLPYDAMERIADAGCGVVHSRAVTYAREHDVPLFVGSSFHDAPGTLVSADAPTTATPADDRWRPLSLVVHDDMALLEISDLPTDAGGLPDDLAAAVTELAPLAEWTRQDGDVQRWGVIGASADVSRLRDLLPDAGDAGTTVFRRGLSCLGLVGPEPSSWLAVRGRVQALLDAHDVATTHLMAVGGTLRLLVAPEDAARVAAPLHDLFLSEEA